MPTGRRSRRDRRPNIPAASRPIPPPRADLLGILRDQVSFLVASSRAFDSGFEQEAVRLAVTLRLLMHQTAASHSLLGQMQLRDRILYFDTARPYGPGNALAESALTIQRITTGAGETSGRFLPRLDRPPISDRWSDSRRWWDLNRVIRDSHGETFTRKDLVLYAANEDGGAHVQPELTPRYEALTRRNALGWELVEGGVSFAYQSPDSGATFDWDNDPAAASVRMIAHEMLLSIQRAVPEAMGATRVSERAQGPAESQTVWLAD